MKVEIFYAGNKVKYRLLEKVIIKGYEIPAGYITDFASVPRSLWNVLPPTGLHNTAAILHDWLYDNRIGERKKADEIFYKVMIESGVNKIAAKVMYWGVRLGGKSWWEN